MRQYLPEVFVQRALTAHLHVQGYQVREEVPFGNSRFDALAFGGDKVLGFEVKLHSWSRAFKQAQTYKLCCDEVYIVIPAGSVTDRINARCLGESVGLVAIGPPPAWDFRIVLAAPPSPIKNRLHHASIQRIAAFR